MSGDEVRNQILLLAGFFGIFVEHRLEAVVSTHAGFHHFGQRALFGVFRGDFQIAADVVGDQFFHISRRFHGNVVTQPGGDEDFLDAGQGAGAAVQFDQRRLIGVEILADAGVNARRFAAGCFYFRVLASQTPHVGGRSAQVGDIAGEVGRGIADSFDLADDRIFRTVLNDAAFVFGDGAKAAAAETAAHDQHRVLDHFECRNIGLAVGSMR